MTIFDRARRDAGFTMVELMVVTVITIMGFLALVHLQAGILRGNSNSWDMVGATHLAQNLLEAIRMEAMEWTDNAGQGVDQAKFQYLKHVNDVGVTQWIRAFDLPGQRFQRVNQAGRDTRYDSGVLNELHDTRNQRFCVRYRLAWMIPNQLIRAEIRVLWNRDNGQGGKYDACPLSPNPAQDMDFDVANVFAATFSTTVMKNAFVSR